MASEERLRIEVGLDGGHGLAALVSVSVADDLERALAEGREGTLVLEAEDGRYVVVLRRVVYVKRFSRESRLGFGSL